MQALGAVRPGVARPTGRSSTRTQFYKDLTLPFFGSNRHFAEVSEGRPGVLVAAGHDKRRQGSL